MKAICAAVIAVVVPATVLAAPPCPQHAPPAGLKRIQDVMEAGRFVAYVPSELRVVDGKTTPVSDASLEADLKILRTRFDGLITYSAHSGVERVPDVAAKLGFRAVIMGMYDIADKTERTNVVAAAKRTPIMAGVSVGNETVYGKRHTFTELAAAIRDLRKDIPGVAVTTTEPFHLLVDPAAQSALRDMDVLLANVHPVFEPWFKAAPDFNGAEFVVNIANDLAKVYCGPVLVKETGVPTAPADKGFTPVRQASFYKELQKQFAPGRTNAFAFFSAFDAPWRVHDSHPVPGYHPEEAHWGLYDERRKAKPVVAEIPALKR
jgi:exo-beta-1,3-glucanase (GH17 family)